MLALYGFQTGRIFCANFPSQQARGASYNLLLLLKKDCLFCHRSECYGPPSPSISLESIKSQIVLQPYGYDLSARLLRTIHQYLQKHFASFYIIEIFIVVSRHIRIFPPLPYPQYPTENRSSQEIGLVKVYLFPQQLELICMGKGLNNWNYINNCHIIPHSLFRIISWKEKWFNFQPAHNEPFGYH